jgi:3-dehydroquinate synthase
MKRSIVLILSVAGAIVATKVLIENVIGVNLEPLVTSWLEQPGMSGAALIVGLLAADVFLPVPSSVIMVLSGAAFGVLWGSVFALTGSVLGEWAGFELVRRYGRRASGKLASEEELEEVNRFFEKHGALAVIVTRPLPVVMETMSLVAGLSRMRRSVFLLASLIGTAPIVVVYAYAGAVSRQVGSALPAIIILIAVAAAGWLWYRSRQSADSTIAMRSTSQREARP